MKYSIADIPPEISSDDTFINIASNIGILGFIPQCPWLYNLYQIKTLNYFFDIDLIKPESLSEIYEKTGLPKFFHTSKISYSTIPNDLDNFINLARLNDYKINSCLPNFYSNTMNTSDYELSWMYLVTLQKNHLVWVLNNYKNDGTFSCLNDVIDFLKANYPNVKDKVKIKDCASMVRFMERWHEKLAEDETYFSDLPEICFGSMPLNVMVDGYQFIGLNTKTLLHVEGRVMNHCVSSYYDNSIHDICRIYSVRDEGGARVATIEINDKFEVVQKKSKSNGNLSKQDLRVVNLFEKNLVNSYGLKFGCNNDKTPLLQECSVWVDSISGLMVTMTDGTIISINNCDG